MRPSDARLRDNVAVPMDLTDDDRSLLQGEAGPAAALAMRVLTRTAEAMGATRLLDVVSAHVDGCLYHGRAGLDFARRLVDGGGAVRIPTTLNVGSLDLLHPEHVRAGPSTTDARALMAAYEQLGCRPTWTCAPYQLSQRPDFGDQIAWAESNAIVFANSVLGARTERYGDFMDICAAIAGRAPAVGLHLDEGRLARLIVRLDGVDDLLDDDAFYPVLGHLLGTLADDRVVAIEGLQADTSEDRLKALGAAAASSGSVGLFHAVGVTPEAPDTASCAVPGAGRVTIGRDRLVAAGRSLTTAAGEGVDAVCVGTPHYSAGELGRLARLVEGRTCRLPLWVNTARDTLAALDATDLEALDAAGVEIVTDTCTYIAPIVRPGVEVVMTDSAKWAYYAPANLGVDVVFASTGACVETALTGRSVGPW